MPETEGVAQLVEQAHAVVVAQEPRIAELGRGPAEEDAGVDPGRPQSGTSRRRIVEAVDVGVVAHHALGGHSFLPRLALLRANNVVEDVAAGDAEEARIAEVVVKGAQRGRGRGGRRRPRREADLVRQDLGRIGRERELAEVQPIFQRLGPDAAGDVRSEIEVDADARAGAVEHADDVHGGLVDEERVPPLALGVAVGRGHPVDLDEDVRPQGIGAVVLERLPAAGAAVAHRLPAIEKPVAVGVGVERVGPDQVLVRGREAVPIEVLRSRVPGHRDGDDQERCRRQAASRSNVKHRAYACSE